MKLPGFRRRLLCRLVSISVCVLLGLTAGANIVVAQTDQSDFIRRVLMNQGQNQGGDDQENIDNGPTGRQQVQTYQPVKPVASPAMTSHLELVYSARAGRRLEQFGYNTFGVPAAVQVGQAGAVQDSYTIGQGDEIVVALRGQENATYRTRVNRDGQIILPKLSPIQAEGRAFGDFRADLESAIHQAFISTNAFVTLGEIHQVSVLVTGAVRTPGTRILSALSTPLDAILLSGGIGKVGSLRGVTLIRGGTERTIDLYKVVEGGSAMQLGTLRDGDRIYVPPLGETIAIAGMVRQPGIYELPRGAHAIGADSLIRLAGGLQIAGSYHFSKMALGSDGHTGLVAASRGTSVRDGEILFADFNQSAATGRVKIEGDVLTGGDRPRSTAPSLRSIFRTTQDLPADAYTEFAVIVRKDIRSNARVLVPFSLEQILSGSGDVPLADDDLVYVFKNDQIRALAAIASSEDPDKVDESTDNNSHKQDNTSDSGNQNNANDSGNQNGANDSGNQADISDSGSRTGGLVVTSTPGADSDASSSAAVATDIRNLKHLPPSEAESAIGAAVAQAREEGLNEPEGTGSTSVSSQINSLTLLAKRLGVTRHALIHFAQDHLVWVLDKVRDPGPYLAADGSTLHGMLQVAGGILREADLSWVEVTTTQIDAMAGSAHAVRTAYKGRDTDFEKVPVHPLDQIRLRPVFSDSEGGRITISGEVRFPGTFDILRGEHLSAIIERAGGLTDQAYPYGAIFTRLRSAVAEKDANAREAAQLESAAAALAVRPNSGVTSNTGGVEFVGGLANQLRAAPALGRIATVADPAILLAKPELDIVVEAGDTLYIPKRPTTVTVSGEVLNAGSFQYRENLSVDDYMRLAGGATSDADNSRIFVVMPDGTARPKEESWLSFDSSSHIAPGSTIVVPRDLRPFDLTQFLKDTTQIISQLAITGASLAILGRN